jgi:hypothetical protein
MLRWLWLGVPLFGLAELGAHQYFAHRAPAAAEWQALRPMLLALRQNDELVVVAPYWAEPLARYAFGAEVFPVAQVARPDPTAFPRAIEVDILGERSSELGSWRLVEEREQGRFRLRVLENPDPARVRFDFWSGLGPAHAEVSVEGPGGEQPCSYTTRAPGSTGGLHGHIAFPQVRFQCPGSQELFVGQTIVDDQNYRPRRCLWARPPRQAVLVARYPSVPLGRVVRGYGALSWFLWRDGGTSPVELEVRVDGESIGTFVHRDEQGWSGFEFPTGSHAGKNASVVFRLRSDRPENREFCFWADTR